MKRFALALGCAAIAFTATASAQTAPQDRVVIRHHGDPAADIDANQDGWITRDEASAAADRVFAALDSDNDGRLTTEDRQSRHIEMRLNAGHDVDVEIRRAEREAARAARQAERAERQVGRHVERHVERSGDGERIVIIRRDGGTSAELEAPAAPTPPMPPRPPHPPMFVMVFANAEEADLNGDGALTRDEFRAQHLRFFDASDANGDGRIRFEPPPAPPEPLQAPEPPAPPTRPR